MAMCKRIMDSGATKYKIFYTAAFYTYKIIALVNAHLGDNSVVSMNERMSLLLKCLY